MDILYDPYLSQRFLNQFFWGLQPQPRSLTSKAYNIY